jgi:transcription termination factor Rho
MHMTEPAQQPLFETEDAKTALKKAPKRRAVKTQDSAAKLVKKALPKKTLNPAKSASSQPEAAPKSAVEPPPSANEATKTRAPRKTKAIGTVIPHDEEKQKPATETRKPSKSSKAPKTPPPQEQPQIPGVEEWSPSGKSRKAKDREPSHESALASAASSQAGALPAESPAQTEAPPQAGDHPTPSQAARQYPVYVPRHVAKQLEQEGKQAPLAVTANEAAQMQIPRSDTLTTRPERQDRNDRSERHGDPQERADRHDRHDHRRDRHDRGSRGHRQERPERGPANDRAMPEEDFSERTKNEPAPRPEELGHGEGIVEISGKGFGFIRDPKRGFVQNPSDIFVTPEMVRKFNLRDGQWIEGETRRGARGSQLHRLTKINGQEPEQARRFPSFDELTVLSPLERIRLETVPERYTTRIMDLMAPIGKGQRGLIVAPPRTGKTTLLQHIADAVVKNHPDIKLIILLVDERPEEVTEFKRSVPQAEIMASSNDMDVKSHTRIAQLAIERAKRLVESGQDVFILLDSITRVGRAFNNASTGGRTMSGGIDSRALEIPRKIFAAARNTEEAGSLTIIATALIETNSRMDDVIFQEFKGTGNMELVLDRKISEQRVYPAVDIFQSGTRREELIVPADELHKVHLIRRGLAGYKPEEAIERLLFFSKKFPTNTQMLREIPG